MSETVRTLPTRLFGITIDNISNLVPIVDGIKEIKQRARGMKPIVRVVFDFDEDTFDEKKFDYQESDFYPEVEGYRKAIEAIAQEAFVMGEIVDSSAIYRC